MSVYFGSFSSRKSVEDAFEVIIPENAEILLASYGGCGYEGDAFVLFRRDGDLYEVNGSHCSCYGLEGQWKPEVTTLSTLRYRRDRGHILSEWAEHEPEAEARLEELLAEGGES